MAKKKKNLGGRPAKPEGEKYATPVRVLGRVDGEPWAILKRATKVSKIPFTQWALPVLLKEAERMIEEAKGMAKKVSSRKAKQMTTATSELILSEKQRQLADRGRIEGVVYCYGADARTANALSRIGVGSTSSNPGAGWSGSTRIKDAIGTFYVGQGWSFNQSSKRFERT